MPNARGWTRWSLTLGNPMRRCVRSAPALADVAVFYEHPQWFEALFAALDRRGVSYVPITIQDHTFDPADTRLPAPVVLNRLAMSSFLRQDEHALFYSLAVLDHWQGLGARVINGPGVLAYD